MTDQLLTKKVDNLSDTVNVLKNQIVKLSEIIERLIRVEEKNATLQKDVNGFGLRLSRIEEHLQTISIKTALNSTRGDLIGRWLERVLWFFLLAALASFDLFKG